jgi:sugar O-acyltransferase (sialic acid O-acetyltransferase NeuD family)
MKKLIIVGAGGFGREVYAWASDHPDSGKAWELAGFIDDDVDVLDRYEYPVGVIGSIEAHQPAADEVFVCAIGAPLIKKKVCQALMERSAEFISLVHPSAILGENIQLGNGVVLCPRVTLTADISVGDFVAINCHSSAGHDVVIGAWATISGHCDLTGNTRYGVGAFLATGVRIVPGKSIGDFSYVGAGSVVIRSVKDGQKVFGNPARVLA